jgi:hypothetical protein
MLEYNLTQRERQIVVRFLDLKTWNRGIESEKRRRLAAWSIT